MRIWVKKHEKVLAACDKDLLGKKFNEGDLHLHVKEDFYGGELVQEDVFGKLLSEMENINLVGENTIKIARKEKMIAEVKKVDKIPYTMIFRI